MLVAILMNSRWSYLVYFHLIALYSGVLLIENIFHLKILSRLTLLLVEFEPLLVDLLDLLAGILLLQVLLLLKEYLTLTLPVLLGGSSGLPAGWSCHAIVPGIVTLVEAKHRLVLMLFMTQLFFDKLLINFVIESSPLVTWR